MSQSVQLSTEGQRALSALQTAANRVLERKARLGQYAVIWRDGRPIASGSESLSERDWLLADKAFNERVLAETPENAGLTRMSTAARIQHIESLLAQIPKA